MFYHIFAISEHAMFQPIFHIMWMYWLLRVLDVRKAGGEILEAFPCLSKSRSAIPTTNPDISDNEDEDVKVERRRIEGLIAGSSDSQVSSNSMLSD